MIGIAVALVLGSQQIGKQAPTPSAADAWVLPLAISAPVEWDKAFSDKVKLLGRGHVLVPLRERNIETLSPAILQVYQEQTKIDFTDPNSWSPTSFSALSDKYDSRFVIGVEVIELGESTGVVDPRAPGARLETKAKVKVYAWDNKVGKMVLDGVEAEADRQTGLPGPSDDIRLGAICHTIGDASFKALKPVIKDFRVTKRSGGGSGG